MLNNYAIVAPIGQVTRIDGKMTSKKRPKKSAIPQASSAVRKIISSSDIFVRKGFGVTGGWLSAMIIYNSQLSLCQNVRTNSSIAKTAEIQKRHAILFKDHMKAQEQK
jgi:hypothetical protein